LVENHAFGITVKRKVQGFDFGIGIVILT